MKCSSCNATVPDGQPFCGNCGTRVAAAESTKQATLGTTSFADLLQRAQSGDSEAQAMVGKTYYCGLDHIAINEAEAVKWFQKAAAQGNALGYWGLGYCFVLGKGGLPKDAAKALEYAQKSVQLGFPDGQRLMGFMYDKGHGVPQNDIEACRWYRLAAGQGDARAQHNLGNMYAEGHGVPQNDIEACRWYRLAADQGDARAQSMLGFMYDEGRGVPQNDAEACRWYRLAADQGDAWAQSRLGFMYSEGRGVPKNDAEACRWFRLSAEQGRAHAQCSLGVMYRDGRGVPKNDTEACRWYHLAADQGYAQAQNNLGWMYEKGRGVPQNDAEACRWYRLAAAQGDSQAQINLQEEYTRIGDNATNALEYKRTCTRCGTIWYSVIKRELEMMKRMNIGFSDILLAFTGSGIENTTRYSRRDAFARDLEARLKCPKCHSVAFRQEEVA